VRKGANGTRVIFAKKVKFNEKNDDERKLSRHRSFTGFNVAQIEELPKEKVCETVIPEDAASTFVVATLADIQVSGDLAGYIPSKTCITLPPAAPFKRIESYYATNFA
jgi:antirestriction protein ArdC